MNNLVKPFDDVLFDITFMDSILVSSEFLSYASTLESVMVKIEVAKHVNTPCEVLAKLVEDESSFVMYAALENPRTPFKAVFVQWHKVIPNSPLWCSPAITGREREYLEMLEEYGLTQKDMIQLPNEWAFVLV